jgi:protein-disulfide isomerase
MCRILKQSSSMKEVAISLMIAAIGVASSNVMTATAQTSSPAAPPAAQGASPASGTPASVPQAPQAPAAPVSPFPPINLKNFNADFPTTAIVNSFLKEEWGYDQQRIWSVAAIQKTAAPGVSRVVVFVANKAQPGKVTDQVFYVTPDGKHAIASGVVDFGANPFADTRKTLLAQAHGPAEGAANSDLLVVEFADLLNLKSRDAQDSINKLVKEIPQVRLVFENLPAPGSQYAMAAATEGVCVRKEKGDAAFFTYVQGVFDKLQGMTAATLDANLSAAVTAAGADPKATAACALTQAAKDDVKASVALAASVNIDQAPQLVINGRVVPPESVPYDTLKQIVAYQAQLDGVTVHVQPTLAPIK